MSKQQRNRTIQQPVAGQTSVGPHTRLMLTVSRYAAFTCALLSLCLIGDVRSGQTETLHPPPPVPSATVTHVFGPERPKFTIPSEKPPVATVNGGWVTTPGALYSAVRIVKPPRDIRTLAAPHQNIITKVYQHNRLVRVIDAEGREIRGGMHQLPAGQGHARPMKNTPIRLAKTESAVTQDAETGLKLAETDGTRGIQTLYWYNHQTTVNTKRMLSSGRTSIQEASHD